MSPSTATMFLNPNLSQSDLEHLVRMKSEAFDRQLETLFQCANTIADPLQRIEYVGRMLPLLFTL